VSAALSAVIPVFLVAGVAWLVRRRLPYDVKTLATLNLYVFIPALIFAHLSDQDVQWGLFGRVALGVVLLTAALSLLLWGVARLRGMPRDMESAFLLTLFANLGNFGLPVVAFAFGKEEGLPYAVIVLVCGSFFQNSLGVFYAQRSDHGALRAFVRVFRFPMIYAFALALLFQRMDWSLPSIAGRAVQITADATIAVQLMILGAKIAETRLQWGVDVFLAAACRLAGGPAVAFAVAWLVGLEGLAFNVFVLQFSGPVAVGIAVYGVQFDVRPGYLASVVTWTFLLSLLSVSAVLTLLYAL
jgi:hypothetical protein